MGTGTAVAGVSGVVKWFNALASTLSGGIPGIIAASVFLALLAGVGGWVYYKIRAAKVDNAAKERESEERKAREQAPVDSRESEDQMKDDQAKLRTKEQLVLQAALDKLSDSDLVMFAGKKYGVDIVSAAIGTSRPPEEIRKEIYKLYGLN